MVFKRFFEVGRLCLVNYGQNSGKLGLVIDIIDANRVIFGFESGERAVVPTKRLTLTPQVVTMPRGVRTAKLLKIADETKVFKQFHESKWGQRRVAAEKKRSLNDFEKFAAMVERRERAKLINRKVKELKQ
ncbi:hypothetical protein PCE1_004665 [Barthelona sp. PCE]